MLFIGCGRLKTDELRLSCGVNRRPWYTGAQVSAALKKVIKHALKSNSQKVVEDAAEN